MAYLFHYSPHRLEGSLSDIGLGALLAACEVHGIDGTVRCDAGGTFGTIELDGGTVCEASYQDKSGDAALAVMSALSTGMFEVKQRKERTIPSSSTTSVPGLPDLIHVSTTVLLRACEEAKLSCRIRWNTERDRLEAEFQQGTLSAARINGEPVTHGDDEDALDLSEIITSHFRGSRLPVAILVEGGLKAPVEGWDEATTCDLERAFLNEATEAEMGGRSLQALLPGGHSRQGAVPKAAQPVEVSTRVAIRPVEAQVPEVWAEGSAPVTVSRAPGQAYLAGLGHRVPTSAPVPAYMPTAQSGAVAIPMPMYGVAQTSQAYFGHGAAMPGAPTAMLPAMAPHRHGTPASGPMAAYHDPAPVYPTFMPSADRSKSYAVAVPNAPVLPAAIVPYQGRVASRVAVALASGVFTAVVLLILFFSF